MVQVSVPEVRDLLSSRKSTAVREREILRVAASLGGKEPQHAAMDARKEVLKWLQKRTSRHLPPTAWEYGSFEHFSGGRNCLGVRISDDTSDIWAIRADDPDKLVPSRVWTTEVVIGYVPHKNVLLSLRLIVASPETDLSVAPAVPGLVHQICDRTGLTRRNIPLKPTPWLVESDEDTESLIDTILDPVRDVPVLVLSVPEHQPDTYSTSIDALSLARATIGLALVVVLPARLTWKLTDRFGKRLSVFNGAARSYLPGFSEDSDPYGHELLLAETINSPQDANTHKERLQRLAARESLRSFKLGDEVLSFAAVRAASLDRAREHLEKHDAKDTDKLKIALEQIRAYEEDLRKSDEFQLFLSDEHQSAEKRATTAEERFASANYRIRQLTSQLRERGQYPDADLALPTKWEGLVDWCDQHLVGRFSLSARARREVKNPAFADVKTAAKCLLWLANDYRDRRLSGGDRDLKGSIDGGLSNERCGSDCFIVDWRGTKVDVQWHIKNGGNTRDPRRCLRIYYFFDEASKEVVVASMPAHIRTDAT